MTPAERRQLRLAARVAVLLASALSPEALERVGVPCPVRALTGRPCPTCGMTRSWSSAARLRLVRAFAYHPAGPVAFALAGAVALGAEPDLTGRRGRVAAVTAAGAWVAIAVARFLAGARPYQSSRPRDAWKT
jgi:hypothetical protein